MRSFQIALIGVCVLLTSCTRSEPERGASTTTVTPDRRDIHSYSNPAQIKVTHLDLDLEVLFDRKVLKGTSTLKLERSANAGDAPLILDTRGLRIEKVEASVDGNAFTSAEFSLGKNDPILGAPLEIKLGQTAKSVRVTYETGDDAAALQWLGPLQTAGKKHPFLFTQSQAILARTWIPLQDSPGVRLTYSARIRTPPVVRALMSAENDLNAPLSGDYRVKMVQPIPSYLLALAVGDIAFRAMGTRTASYAEPSVVDAAGREFADTEKMIEATEKIYGPYRWDRYDILVLPPSFPFGGM